MQRIQEQIVELNKAGYYVGPRDPARNQAFLGEFMVCEVETLSEPPSDDAKDGGFCIVGNNLFELVETAFRDCIED